MDRTLEIHLCLKRLWFFRIDEGHLAAVTAKVAQLLSRGEFDQTALDPRHSLAQTS
jgi:hypothetical protein